MMAEVLVRQAGNGHPIWHKVAIDANSLGSFDWESDEIGKAIDEKYGRDQAPAFGSPAIVVTDPSGQFEPGCSTQSHWDSDQRDRSDHSECEHDLVTRLFS